MAALAKDRNTVYGSTSTMRHRRCKVKAATKIYKGALVCKTAAGYLVPASDTAGLTCVGVSEENVDNTAGADGALDCAYVTGVEATFATDGNVVQGTLKATALDDQTLSAAATTVHDVFVGPVAAFTAATATVFIDEGVNAVGV